MAKVCFFSVQWLEEARFTADNLLIAKIMIDFGKPLNPDLNFYVGNGGNDSSLFFEVLKSLFSVVDTNEEEEEQLDIFCSNKGILRWIQLRQLIQETSMFEAFRMTQAGLESTLTTSSDHFDVEYEGMFTEKGLALTMKGCMFYGLYHEFLEAILLFEKELKVQLQIWEVYYHEHSKGSQRNTYHAS